MDPSMMQLLHKNDNLLFKHFQDFLARKQELLNISAVRFAPMSDPLNNDRFLFDLKQYPLITHTQAILGG
jgi:hypothetical protein